MRIRQLTTLGLLALGLAAVPGLSAQTPSGAPPAGGPPAGGGQRGRMQAMLMEGITLTPAQQTKVDSIRAYYRSQMPQMTPGTPPSDADRQKAMGLMQSSTKAVRGVLTPDQQAIYDKNLASMQQMMGGGMPSGGAAPTTGAPAKP